MNIARMPYQWPGLASYNITQSYSISLCKQSTSHWEFSSLGLQFQCKVWRSLPLVLEFLLRLGRWTGTLFVFSSFTSIVGRIFRAVCKIKPHASPITLHFTTSCKCEGIFTVGTLCNHTCCTICVCTFDPLQMLELPQYRSRNLVLHRFCTNELLAKNWWASLAAMIKTQICPQ